jgi:hypothetical protein
MEKKNTMMIYGRIKDGDHFQISPITGKELIERIWTNDYAMPPENVVFDTKTKNGERVRIVVPFDDTNESYAIIDNKNGN